MTNENQSSGRGWLGRATDAVADALAQRLDAGDRAALRRMNDQGPYPPAFWHLVFTVLEPLGAVRDDHRLRSGIERRWAVISRALATAGALHRPGSGLGEALAFADVSELRFRRLLLARGDAQADAVRRTTHVLVSKAEEFDGADLAALVLFTRGSNGASLRRRIARQFYRRLLTA